MQQPKPEDFYDLDMAAMEFSSTQQMLEDGLPQGAIACICMHACSLSNISLTHPISPRGIFAMQEL